jgi:hypothetical protein
MTCQWYSFSQKEEYKNDKKLFVINFVMTNYKKTKVSSALGTLVWTYKNKFKRLEANFSELSLFIQKLPECETNFL